MRHPGLTVALAESNIAWLPYVLERADTRWGEDRAYQAEWKLFDRPPSSYFASNMFCSFFNDRAGLAYIDKVGVKNSYGFENLTFEIDYPHADSTWPDSLDAADVLMDGLADDVKKMLLHDNAARLLRLAT
jgi:predicted TIM-barrel fold metal-dependent hydrolase